MDTTAMITIDVADYYGIPSYYSVMPESVFAALECAFLNGNGTASIPMSEYIAMRDAYIIKMAGTSLN